eukprot:CAMPEP_0171075412 /NCGR_PEP_ID=MMETSP0766_2-20121228/12763_1 /TAXON_ID=439317 /ORGANISM="Gambierdiscus australes, Strain CAWD 149" /LENGTH=199 /DNA_ID=CAMNT_0011532279 /DNA_START=60 /DNA_END=656 /DNA_ORIENTATION=+
MAQPFDVFPSGHGVTERTSGSRLSSTCSLDDLKEPESQAVLDLRPWLHAVVEEQKGYFIMWWWLETWQHVTCELEGLWPTRAVGVRCGHFTRVCTGVPTYGEKETPFPQKEAVITVVESAISFTVVATVLQQLRFALELSSFRFEETQRLEEVVCACQPLPVTLLALASACICGGPVQQLWVLPTITMPCFACALVAYG